MRHQFVELRERETGHGVLINLERVTRITELTGKTSRIHFTGTDDTVIVRESLAQIIDKLPHVAGWTT